MDNGIYVVVMISVKTEGETSETRGERWKSEHREMADVELNSEKTNRKYMYIRECNKGRRMG
jgi:hypothetical protein